MGVRLYTAWLAHHLARVRTALTEVVLPGTLEMIEASGKASDHTSSTDLNGDTQMLAWGADASAEMRADPKVQEEREKSRRRSRRRSYGAAAMVLLVVFIAASAGIFQAEAEAVVRQP